MVSTVHRRLVSEIRRELIAQSLPCSVITFKCISKYNCYEGKELSATRILFRRNMTILVMVRGWVVSEDELKASKIVFID